MKSVRITVSLRPKLYEWVKKQAEIRQVSISRYVEDCVDGREYSKEAEEDDCVYSKEDLDASIREAEEGLRNGTLPSFSTAEEMFIALDKEIRETSHKIHAAIP